MSKIYVYNFYADYIQIDCVYKVLFLKVRVKISFRLIVCCCYDVRVISVHVDYYQLQTVKCFKVFLSRTLTSKKIYVLIHISFNFHPFKVKLKRWAPLRVRVMKIYLRCPEFEKVFYWIFVTLTLRYAHSSSLSSNG